MPQASPAPLALAQAAERVVNLIYRGRRRDDRMSRSFWKRGFRRKPSTSYICSCKLAGAFWPAPLSFGGFAYGVTSNWLEWGSRRRRRNKGAQPSGLKYSERLQDT